MRRHRPARGHVLALFLLAMMGISALVLTAANGRLAREAAADQAFRGAAAEALAQSGLEVAVAALRQGQPMPDLIEELPATFGPGQVRLTVVSKTVGGAEIRSCGTVGVVERCLLGQLRAAAGWGIEAALSTR